MPGKNKHLAVGPPEMKLDVKFTDQQKLLSKGIDHGCLQQDHQVKGFSGLFSAPKRRKLNSEEYYSNRNPPQNKFLD